MASDILDLISDDRLQPMATVSLDKRGPWLLPELNWSFRRSCDPDVCERSYESSFIAPSNSVLITTQSQSKQSGGGMDVVLSRLEKVVGELERGSPLPATFLSPIRTDVVQFVYEHAPTQKHLNIIFESLQAYDAQLPPLKLSACEKQVCFKRVINRWHSMTQERKFCASKEKRAFCQKNKIKHIAHHQMRANKQPKG